MADAVSSPSTGGADAPVDYVWLRECTDDDPVVMKSLLDLFFNRTTTLLKELDAAIAAGNAPEVRRLAHACVGSCGACGMVKQTPHFKTLEKLGAAGTLEGASAALTAAHTEFSHAKEYVNGMTLR